MPFGYEPHMPVDVVFNAVEDLVEYASLANQPFSDRQAVSKAYNVFNKTRHFVQAITEWNRRPDNEKTMANLKLTFAARNVNSKNLQDQLSLALISTIVPTLFVKSLRECNRPSYLH